MKKPAFLPAFFLKIRNFDCLLAFQELFIKIRFPNVAKRAKPLYARNTCKIYITANCIKRRLWQCMILLVNKSQLSQ